MALIVDSGRRRDISAILGLTLIAGFLLGVLVGIRLQNHPENRIGIACRQCHFDAQAWQKEKHERDLREFQEQYRASDDFEAQAFGMRSARNNVRKFPAR